MFKKILLIGIDQSRLDDDYQKKLADLGTQVVSLDPDNINIKEELKDTDCLLVAFGVAINAEDIDCAPQLKYIGVMATAYHKIDIEYARKKDIVVSNLGGYSTEAVAEFVIGALLEHLRGLEIGKNRGRTGDYSEAGINATEIKGRIFGIIGLGSIGGRVAELAQSFGAKVIYWSRNRKPQYEAKGIVYSELDDVIAQADFLSLHPSHTSDTDHILSAERIQKLKSGMVLINTSPMELVDLNGLNNRLSKQDITFIFDHSDQMPAEEVKKLSSNKNCIIYPPIAYITEEARIRKQETLVDNIKNFLAGTPSNKVN